MLYYESISVAQVTCGEVQLKIKGGFH